MKHPQKSTQKTAKGLLFRKFVHKMWPLPHHLEIANTIPSLSNQSHNIVQRSAVIVFHNISFLRVNAYKNGPKSPINGTSRKIDFACISSLDRS